MTEPTQETPPAAPDLPADKPVKVKRPRLGAMVTFVSLNGSRVCNGAAEYPGLITQLVDRASDGRTVVNLTLFPPFHSTTFAADVPHESEADGGAAYCWRW